MPIITPELNESSKATGNINTAECILGSSL